MTLSKTNIASYSGIIFLITTIILILTATVDSRPPPSYSCDYEASVCGKVYLNKTDASILIELQSSFPSLKESFVDWNTSLTCGNGWTGVCIDSKGKVTEILLFGYLGDGIIPNTFSKLEKLVRLDLGYNGLSENHILPVAKLPSLLELNLYGNELATIPSSFASLSKILKLDLQSNNINESAFDVLVKMKSLTNLNLSYNANISIIPSSIGSLSNLLTLDLSFTEASTLPSSLGSLPKLNLLIVRGNFLSNSIFPAIVKLKSLHYLDLSSNALTLIPASISLLSNLKSLILDYNKLTGGSIDAISKLKQLTDLSLENNNLNYLPPSIGNLTNLINLSVSSNYLHSNSTVHFLKLKALRYLYLFNNELTTLPSTFGTLQNLDTLHLSFNNLDRSVLPIIGSIKALTFLDLAYNPSLRGPIPSFPNLTSLRHLSFYECTLTGSVPSSFGSFPQLTYLNLGYNDLCGSVPEYFADFPSYAFLDLEYNKLSGRIPAAVQAKFSGKLYSIFQGNCLISENGSDPLPFSNPIADCTAACYPIPNLREDLAYKATTRQSSINWGGMSSLAVDGSAGLGSYFNGSCSHTRVESVPWLMVGLRASYRVRTVQIYNRLDCCSDRLNGVRVYVGSSSGAHNATGNSACADPGFKYGAGKKGFPLNVTCNKSGKFVWVVLPGDRRILTVCEVVVLK